MKTRLLLLGGLFLASVSVAPAADDWRLIVKLQGQVHSSVDNKASWQPVFAQRLLRPSDAARTLADSKARIQMPDGSVAIMAANTVAVLQEFDDQKGGVKVYVETGGVRARVTKAFGRGRFELNTKNGVLAAQGTDYAVAYEGEDLLTFVYEGVVSMETSQGTQLLKPGDAARLGANGTFQINPPGLNYNQLPPVLQPPPVEPVRTETSTYVQATGGGQGTSNLRFNQLNSFLLPSDAGNIMSGGVNQPATPAPTTPTGTTGTIQVDIRF